MDRVINYQLISLTMMISKVLEKIIYTRVYKILESNSILCESQYSFRNKRSCEQAITELLGHILQTKENGDSSASIFLDLSKAFDTLKHTVLLKKLDHYGIRGIPNNWFKSYLSDRSLKAKVSVLPNKIVYSEKFSISYGTAQGSCLRPLLFVLFCNDIHLIPIYGHLILFADDTTLLNHHHNRNFLNYMMTHDMNLLTDWFKANQLLLNLCKTVSIFFWPGKFNLSVTIDGQQIPQVSPTCFLCVTLDNELCWIPHISQI